MTVESAYRLFASGQFRKALTALDSGSDKQKQQADHTLLLAHVQSELQLYEQAEAGFAIACKAAAPQAWLLRGYNAMRCGQVFSATDFFRIGLKASLSPEHKAIALAALAHAEAAAGWNVISDAHAQRAQQQNPAPPENDVQSKYASAQVPSSWGADTSTPPTSDTPGEFALRYPVQETVALELAAIQLLRKQWEACAESLLALSSGQDPRIHMLRAKLALRREHFQDADEILDSLVTQVPECIEAWLLRGKLAMQLRQWDRAADAFSTAAAIHPESANADTAWLQTGIAHYENGLTDKAKAVFESCQNNAHNDAMANQASYYFTQLQDTSTQVDQACLQDFPFHLHHQNRYSPAVIANLTSHYGLDLSPEDISRMLFDHGVAHWKLPAFARELNWTSTPFYGEDDALRSLLDLNVPVLCDEYEGLNGRYILLLGYDSQLGVWIIQTPDNREPLRVPFPEFRKKRKHSHQWASVLLPNEQSAFLQDLTLPGRDTMQIFDRACEEFERGQYSSAAASARETLTLDSSFMPAYKLIIQTDMSRKNWSAAADRLREWLARHPKSAWGNKFLADCFFELQNEYLASKYYRTSLEAHPGQYAATVLLGRCCTAIEQAEEAERWLRKAADIDPSQGWALLFLGEALEQQGDREGAALYYGIAKALDRRYTFQPDTLSARTPTTDAEFPPSPADRSKDAPDQGEAHGS